ncbi:hypothetical protein CONCODRAFT_73134 [Conidiobolus coronatus NRRL 28638]|uniref:F-box domain-containing protein n=1 Tax=Conidiobolus coronatus (strain ATCC 28846 / CBS 209.66 / NRRL 28638) TaxID=796925 RepID=A0A137NWW5_CONC2|nr:hypothetical protein CONCODRAFT_73134 [Conidiobolus coronatus NRRL 28638]|eukprot:KXN67232.1 hypothetical protein CONCODRAFT_73134 [Conidiobolus coronatus NRRL 28638]
MSEINWSLILQKREFYSYITYSECIELSLINQLIRSKLKFRLNSYFNAIKYFNEGYRPRIESELNEAGEEHRLSVEPIIIDSYLNEIEQDLLNLPNKRYIKALKFNETIPVHFLNLMLVQIFPNLTHLEFNRVRVPFKSLLEIFDKLDRLEHLDLSLTRIIKYREENYTASDLIFPESLISLKFSELGLAISQSRNYPKVLYYNTIQDFEDMIGIGIHPQTLPNLKYFTYNPKLSANYENTQSFLKFLNLNKIHSLGTLPRFLTSEIINELAKSNILKYLKLGLFLRNNGTLDTSLVKIDSITKLKMHVDFKTKDFVIQISSLFSQVNQLILNCHYSHSNVLESILLNFPKLKKLTLKSYNGIHTDVFKRLNLPLLREITLFSDLYSSYMISNFDNLNSLKMVAVEWEYDQPGEFDANGDLVDRLGNWICYNSGDNAQYYRKLA